MRLKIFTEPTYTAKARNAAIKYVEQKEFKKAGFSIPGVLCLICLFGVFVLLLYFR